MLTRTTVSVLGKRKPSASSYAIQLQSTPESAQEQATVAKVKPIIINGRLADGNTKKRYQCTSAGCEKAYTKPSRLAEHMRSHTGEMYSATIRL
ncbi:hypothetical protein D9757_005591 [Collybiopsis confluens]|uniref:C2H2-type domain-containing protein n=1 Tax=Collybiopsis confluens TaxID=2823264 RepID=A0A8H5HSM6_9AGAR|nr:hypothetical protein D9757_005591 [Collybiopsis confluens]